MKVRAYYIFNDVKYNGKWSAIKAKKVETTGMVEKTDAIYYYKNGKAYSGNINLDGNPYYFKKGALRGVNWTMFNKIDSSTSSTKYAIVLSRNYHRICVYKRTNKEWKVIRYCRCSIGASETPTPTGSFKVLGHVTMFGHAGNYSVWKATRFYKTYYFHSILTGWRNKASIVDGRLGMSISHGCVRMAMDDATFLYKHSPKGSRVIVY